MNVTFCTYLLFFLSLSIFSPVAAQNPALIFDHVTVEEGLSQSTVFAITQDAEGFMWFATRDGLNRYDSRGLEIFRHDPEQKTSLSDNTVYSLFSDQGGRLWVGTRNGLNLYDPKTGGFKHYYAHANNPRSLSNNAITCIFKDAADNLWIGTRKGLNLLVVRDSVEFVRFMHEPKNSNSLANDDIRSVFQDRDGVMWVGTSSGFSRLVYQGPDKFSFTSFQLPGASKLNTKSNWINAFAEDSNGNLLIGTENSGLKLFNRREGRFVDAPWTEKAGLRSNAIRTILKDPQGDFWIGTIGGLIIINPAARQYQKFSNVPDNPYSISDNSIRSIFIDRTGSYWIGTFHGGVNSYSPLSRQFQYFNPGIDRARLHFKIASALRTDQQQNLWIGTEGDGLFFVDRKRNITRRFKQETGQQNSLSHNNIKCLLLDGNKGIWIGTIKGLDYYDFRRKQFRHYNLRSQHQQEVYDDAVYDLADAGDGTIWVATYRNGLIRFNPATGIGEENYIRNPKDRTTITTDGVTKLWIDGRQNLWVGTVSGLNKKEKGRKEFKRFTHKASDSTSISGQYIYSLYEDTQHRLWVGTRGKGLSLLLSDGKSFRRFTTAHGLAGNSVYGMLEDSKGFLWLSTENGLSRLDPETFMCRNFNSNDGLVCKEFNFNSYDKDDAGYMYFGGYNGIVFFHPDSIQENNTIPALAFTRLKVFNKEIQVSNHKNALLRHRLNYTKQLDFRHDQNIFAIEFAVLNYINAQKNQFAYKLDGFEDQWNVVKEPVATYMNLTPGKYTLLVKGANNDGIWNEKPLALSLYIHPPPWKTGWAFTLYGLVFLALLYTWARINRKRVKLEHDLRLEHMEKQKQEELHQAKLNFFTNIAHEIRTPLTLMAGPVEQLSDRLQEDPFLKKEIELVRSNADRLMRLLNQLLDFQRQETGNVKLKFRKENFVSFIREILYPFQEFADSRRIILQLHAEETQIPLWFDREEMAKVFYNLLANAFKFTPGGGKVCVHVTKEVSATKSLEGSWFIKITIEDNGLGIAESQLEKIFHRFYQAENTGMQEAGFGIGLALAKGIVDLHHGTIMAESREATQQEHGFTRFTILLPGNNTPIDKDEVADMVFTDDPETTALQQSEVGKTSQGQSDDKITRQEKHLILIVEDNDDIRNYIYGILKQAHYEVLESRNGLEGWHTAVERLPDLIISDVIMSGMNGLDLVTKLKADQRTSHVPVILLTGRVSLNHQVEGLIVGADDYLTKPFNIKLLLVKIKNHLAIRDTLKEKYSKIVTLQPQQEKVEDPDHKFLQRLMEAIEANLLDPDFNVSGLVREIGMSRPVLFRKVKMLTGLSVIDLIRSVRLKKAEMLLKQRKLSIAEVAFAVGFNDPKYFSKTFKEQYGLSPSQYIEES